MTNRNLEQFIGRPSDPRDPVEGLRGRGRLAQAINDFEEVVRAGIELGRAQLPFITPADQRLEGISFEAARLLLESGAVSTIDEGVVIFHDRISRDKPALRAILRKSDRRAGRLKRVKTTLAQRATRLAVKSGMVIRGTDGKFKRLSPTGRALVQRAKKREAAARRKKTIAKQKRTAARLRGLF